METTGFFALMRGGFALLRGDHKLYMFGLVVGALSVFPATFVNQATSDITPGSPDSEMLAAMGAVLTVTLVFGLLSLFAHAVLTTYAVRAAQGRPSVGDAIDRVRRRVWAVLLFGPVVILVMFALFIPFAPLIMLSGLVDPTGILVGALIAGWLTVIAVMIVGMWAVVPSFTISDVRFPRLFRVTWNGVRNGGLRYLGMAIVVGTLSVLTTGLADFAFTDTSPFGLSTLFQIPIIGFLFAWYAGAVGYLWVAEAPNLVVGLENTAGEAITESTTVCNDGAT